MKCFKLLFSWFFGGIVQVNEKKKQWYVSQMDEGPWKCYDNIKIETEWLSATMKTISFIMIGKTKQCSKDKLQKDQGNEEYA